MKKRADTGNDASLVTNSIIVLVMVIVGFGWYLSTRLKTPQPDPVPAVNYTFDVLSNPLPTPVPGVTETFTGTVAALITKGQSMECDVASVPSDTDAISGKLWTFSATGRSNLSVPIGRGMAVVANSVHSGNIAYSWFDMTGKVLGYRIDLTASASAAPTQKRQIVDVLVRDLTFTCTAWTPDQRVLTLPPNVDFH